MALLVLAFMHMWLNKPTLQQRARVKTADVCINFTCVSAQLIGIMNTIEIEWPPPLLSYFRRDECVTRAVGRL